MKTRSRYKRLRRYTNLPVLLDLLRRKKLVLLNPEDWEDKNDSQCLSEYKTKKQIQKLFVICFCNGDETIHHWKNYSRGISGCCIEFDKEKLLKSFRGINEIRSGDVEYKTIKSIEDNPLKINEMPFTKRYPYRIEKEFRILWEGQTSRDNVEIGINLNSIVKITISQNMPSDVYRTIVDLLQEEIKDAEKIINRSTVFESKRWIRALKNSQ